MKKAIESLDIDCMNKFSSDISYVIAETKEKFGDEFINENRGRPLFLILFQNLQNILPDKFIELIVNKVKDESSKSSFPFKFHIFNEKDRLYLGVSPQNENGYNELPNIDSIIGNFYHQYIKHKKLYFEFGVGRTQCNYISEIDEILSELFISANQNLIDNLKRWNWTFFNKTHDFFANDEANAVIQPVIFYDYQRETFSLKGGEVFIGGDAYSSYSELLSHIPEDKDINRVELLILEKLISACRNSPGLLKMNITPQSLIDTFYSREKVRKFIELIEKNKLNTKNIRLEIVEKPYEEDKITLKEVCEYFHNFGITFAADDFGVKNQSHQIVLELGRVIKEFKLDPISFKFKVEEDHTKFLDNLAFIEYCKRLADNREAIITAEAVEDYETLSFLLTHQIHYFQTNILCKKITIENYNKSYHHMQNLPEKIVRHILTDEKLLEEYSDYESVFKLAKSKELI